MISDGGATSITPSDRDAARRGAVLIVEDEHVARRALTMLLASIGYRIKAVGSAEEALRALETDAASVSPRVALVDLNLPGMNGVEFISRLEQIEPAVLPVLMTAAGEDDVRDAVKDRNLVYLRKPLDLGELLTAITHGEQGLGRFGSDNGDVTG